MILTEFQICWIPRNTPLGKSEQHLFEIAKMTMISNHDIASHCLEKSETIVKLSLSIFTKNYILILFSKKAQKGLSLICDFNSLIGRKTLLDPSTLFKSTVLDTRRQCQEIIKQNDLPQCDRGTPLTFSLPCPLNIKPATAL